VQWGQGAVSTATWTGVPLAALLERAAVQASALHFWMEAADRGPLPATPTFLRSIPRETALGEAFVAYEMNGQPLPLLHGGPLRLVVPRWYGMASTKWLTHVHARTTESDNHFMARGYRYADGSPVDLMRVKSLITAPLDGASLASGPIPVAGFAWAGETDIARVEVSADSGATWHAARLVGEQQRYTWRRFEHQLTADRPGSYLILSRATDATGVVQPAVAHWNPSGYLWNQYDAVRVEVK